MKKNLFGLFEDEIAKEILPLGLKKFRAKQIADWMYHKNVHAFSEMKNLPLGDRKQMEETFSLFSVKQKAVHKAADGNTEKFLLEYADGVFIETVLMRHPYGNSVCVSTQAGCAMGCKFCASTLHGLKRNLSAGEIFAQVFYVNTFLMAEKQRVNTVVIMGSGEPLANYEEVIKFIRLCHEPYTLQLGYRNFTLSTSGIVPMIDRLSEENIPVTLSISLHAADDLTRSKLMPINQTYPIHEVMAAAARYAQKTGRRVTYEYILIAECNDSVSDAERLSNLLRGQLANVNLIPVNPVEERGLRRPSEKRIRDFESTLKSRHINVTIRREMGKDIQAACGQLRNRHL